MHSTIKKQLLFAFFTFTALSILLANELIFEVNNSENQQRYLQAQFEQVEITKDLAYGEAVNYEGVNETLLLDIYSPLGDTNTNRPVIVWIHGGGYRIGSSKTQNYIVTLANEFAKRGFVCLSIDYRLRAEPKDDKKGTVTDAVNDAMVSIEWIRKNHKKYGIDPSKIIVGGGSAGGRTAVNLCYKDETDNEKWDKNGIIGLIDLWGTPDESWFISTIDSNDPPTLIIHGTKDELVPYENSVLMAAQLKEAKVKHLLYTIEGAGHTPIKEMDELINQITIFINEVL